MSEPWAGSARELAARLAADGLRRPRCMNARRCRTASGPPRRRRSPTWRIVGEREAGAGTVAVRKRGAGRKQETMTRQAFAERLLEEAASGALGSRKPSGTP